MNCTKYLFKKDRDKIYFIVKFSLFLLIMTSHIAQGNSYHDWLKNFSYKSPISGGVIKNLPCAQKDKLYEIIKKQSSEIRIPNFCTEESIEQLMSLDMTFDSFGNQFNYYYEKLDLKSEGEKSVFDESIKFDVNLKSSLNIFFLTYYNALRLYFSNLGKNFNYIFLSTENFSEHAMDYLPNENRNFFFTSRNILNCYTEIYRYVQTLQTPQERTDFFNNEVNNPGYIKDSRNLVFIYDENNLSVEDHSIFNQFNKKVLASKKIKNIDVYFDFIPDIAKRLSIEKVFLLLGVNLNLYKKPLDVQNFHKDYPYEYKNIVFQQKNFHKGIESLLNELNRMAFSKDICLSFHGLLESPDNLAIYRF